MKMKIAVSACLMGDVKVPGTFTIALRPYNTIYYSISTLIERPEEQMHYRSKL